MAGQGPHAKATAAAKEKKRSSKTELVAFLDMLGNDELSCASIEEVPDEMAELVVNSWSTLLDSGATSHLIKGCDYFWIYNEEEAWSVKTANLGVLQTHASGTCIAHFMCNRVSMRVMLKDCLHAPNAYVNLLSVRRFVTAKIACTFEDNHVLLSKKGKAFRCGPMVNKTLCS